MSPVAIAGLFLAGLLVLMALRLPIGIAMFLTGAAGYTTLAGWDPLLNHLKSQAYGRYSNYDLSVVPMFLLMGNLATRGGLSSALFAAANSLIGHFRGGIAMAAVGACAAFGAICGLSLATAATMGQIALPELRKFNYAPALATGALAAGGTLGILIPPSVVLAIYAILTEQNIAKLFTAAFIPGIIAMLGYMIVIAIYVRVKPGSGPGRPAPQLERTPGRVARDAADLVGLRDHARRHVRRRVQRYRGRGDRHRCRCHAGRHQRAALAWFPAMHLFHRHGDRHDLFDSARRRSA